MQGNIHYKLGKALLVVGFVLVAILLTPNHIWAQAKDSKWHVGVLANKGKLAALETWQPLMDYLESSIPGYKFILVPLGFDELYPELKAGNIDFIITNTGQYIELEVECGISRLATLRSAGPNTFHTKFGGVLFVRADCDYISEITDFPGYKVLAADEKSFGGWLMQLREIKNKGVDPSQFAEFGSTGNHELVVLSVLEGKFDIGAVRTNVLESMVQSGKIELDSIKIINQQHVPGFPFLHSTRLYPEWPFAKAAHTDSVVAQEVSIALLTMPQDSLAAVAAQSGGWTIPEDYSAAHELFRELKLGPYEQMGEFNIIDVLKKYWPIILLSTLLLIVAGAAAIWVSAANRRLERALYDLDESHTKLEAANSLLMESMEYAQIIQESLLPDEEYLKTIVPELAILWEPLDMVSGDYYWIDQIEDKLFFMIADCTGHGVPGALVTMILSASLDFVLREEKTLDPAVILKEIDRSVRKRLRQDEPNSVSDDGLEAAICVFDPISKRLFYSGAGLPLFYVKSGKICFIKADLQQLGYRTLQPTDPFRVHTLALDSESTFYMFTDGLINQVGGTSGYMFGRKRFADLIADISKLPLPKQIDIIKDHLREYRGQEKARDDMTLIGFRLK